MEVTQTLLQILFGFALFAKTFSKECEVSQVEHCYDSLAHYESLAFPLYGENEMELDETCNTIMDSFECVETFLDVCRGRTTCDHECEEMIRHIDVFAENTGLRAVYQDLCDPHGAIRQAYLENYPCLESNSYHYAACHNDSQMSQEHMLNIRNYDEAKDARCCFFTWYHDCFTNITRDTCNENATLFVSLTLYKLTHRVSEKLCGPNPDVCERPPLPEIDTEEDKTTSTVNSDSNDIGITKSDIDNTDTSIDDIDNSIEEKEKSSSTSPTCSVWTFISAVLWMTFTKYML